MDFICFNGKFLPAHEAVVTSQNRSLRYGDGIFETIKIFKEQILLKDFHFERLYSSLELLMIDARNLPENILEENIKQLCHQNDCLQSAKVRLAVFREEGNYAGYIIEATPLSHETNQWNIWQYNYYKNACTVKRFAL